MSLINKETALKEVSFDTEAYNAINMIPVIDAVEVVWCEDCRFFSPRKKENWGICSNWDGITYPDGFCSYAERKTTDVDKI